MLAKIWFIWSVHVSVSVCVFGSGMSPNARHSDDAQVLDAALNIDPSSPPKVLSLFITLYLLHATVSFMPVAQHSNNVQVIDSTLSIDPSSAVRLL